MGTRLPDFLGQATEYLQFPQLFSIDLFGIGRDMYHLNPILFLLGSKLYVSFFGHFPNDRSRDRDYEPRSPPGACYAFSPTAATTIRTQHDQQTSAYVYPISGNFNKEY